MKSIFPISLLFALLLPLPQRSAAQQTSPNETPATNISALVAEIAAGHPELKFYEAEIAAAKAGVRSSAALAEPELSIEYGRKRVKSPAGVLAGEGDAWSVSITQQFEWPGRLALRKAIANGQVELAELGLSRFRHALDGRVRSLAHRLHAAHLEALAIREVAERFAELKATFLAREPAGITPLLETRVIEASELSLQRRATEAELALHSALIELNQLRGAPHDRPLRIASPVVGFNDAPATTDLLGAARENNFEFRLRQLELAQQGFQVRLARNERYPAISVSPFVTQEQAGERETVVGLGLSVPLPVTGRARSSVDVAEIRRRQAETAALIAHRDLDREVLTTANEYQMRVQESRRWAPDSSAKFREAAALADRHYRLGAVPIGTYVELQTSYLDAIESLLATERAALEAALKLQQLTGLDGNLIQSSAP